MNKNIIIGVMVVIVVALGGWWLYTQNTVAPVTQETQQQQENNETTITGEGIEITVGPVAHEVIYTNSGYAPATLTVKAGDTVTFKNQSTANVWTGSAMHPTHVVYSGTNLQAHCPDVENNDFDQCKNEGPGTSWSFTFTKAGTWGYHNHANASHFGKVIVE